MIPGSSIITHLEIFHPLHNEEVVQVRLSTFSYNSTDLVLQS